MSFIIHKSLKVWKENTEVEAYHKKEIPNQSRENKHLSSKTKGLLTMNFIQ